MIVLGDKTLPWTVMTGATGVCGRVHILYCVKPPEYNMWDHDTTGASWKQMLVSIKLQGIGDLGLCVVDTVYDECMLTKCKLPTVLKT